MIIRHIGKRKQVGGEGMSVYVETPEGVRIPLGGSAKGLRNMIKTLNIAYQTAPKIDLMSDEFVHKPPNETLVFIGDMKQRLEIKLNKHRIVGLKPSFLEANSLCKKHESPIHDIKVIQSILESRFNEESVKLIEMSIQDQNYLFESTDQNRGEKKRLVVNTVDDHLFVASADIIEAHN